MQQVLSFHHHLKFNNLNSRWCWRMGYHILSIRRGKHLKILKEIKFPHSLGLLYSAFTYYLGFKVNSGEYKVMGLCHMVNQNIQI